jgi:8-oxo-dGTP pyrophosphatase MutT (NUDIX family)
MKLPKKEWISGLNKVVQSAKLLLLNNNNELLIVETNYKGWDIVGGIAEKGETIINTLLRETKEEIGLDVKSYNPRLIGLIKQYITEGEVEFEWYYYLIKVSDDNIFDNIKLEESELLSHRFIKLEAAKVYLN